MEFEWDAAKAQSNLAKHGIPFEVAAGVFLDPARITVADTRFDYGEARDITIGRTPDGILVVITTHRDAPPRLRIISARKANSRERRRYADRET